ncbi:MAG: hypothetical protein QOH65_2374 [Methylobacteriaceae bacterium]|jgi:hypothetical protein|nr:hypothetical protein [Methylobacteriaceae bacterium]
MKHLIFGALIAGSLSAVAFVSPASAQATRTWVSGVGDDANPCSRTAPCKTFAGAISKTAASGEINVLDPGGFGGVTINKALTIRSDHVEAGVLVAGTNAITVNAGTTDMVTLDGLDIEGLSPPNASPNGVVINSGLTVHIIRCRIHGFSSNGVQMQSSTNNSRVVVENSQITRNAGGMNVQNPAGVSNAGLITNTLVDTNTSFALQANGTLSSISYAYDTLTGSANALSLLNGGQIFSFGPSSIVAGGVTTPTQTFPFK